MLTRDLFAVANLLVIIIIIIIIIIVVIIVVVMGAIFWPDVHPAATSYSYGYQWELNLGSLGESPAS